MKYDLMQGDCLDLMEWIPDKSIDMILSDVPYRIVTGGDSDGANSKRPKGILSGNRELMANIPAYADYLPHCYRVLKDESHAYFMINSTNLIDFGKAVEASGFKTHNILVWVKNNCTPSQFYMKNCEYVIFARKGRAKYINDIGNSKTAHVFNNIIGGKVHPTEKPTSLMEFYIKNSSREGDTVLDMFMGSGSTGVACVNTNRNFIGIELDKNYFDIAKNRIENARKSEKPMVTSQEINE